MKNTLAALCLVSLLLISTPALCEECSTDFFATNFKHALNLRKEHLKNPTRVKPKREYQNYFERKLPVLFDKLVSCHKSKKGDHYLKIVLEFFLSIRGEASDKSVTVMNRLFKLSPKNLSALILAYEKKEALYLTKLLNFSWKNANAKKSKKPKSLLNLNSQVNQK